MDLFKQDVPFETRKDSLSPRLFHATGARTTSQAEWVEIQTKSVLNRVQGMSFKWSVNPYRGCQHDCVFCVDPDTPILMADGTLKPIEAVHAGDRVYGTIKRGEYRRFVRTQVLAQWETRKSAYKITLTDGTRLVASGDHRFLTNRGWKFVTGAEWGPNRRPFLTPNNKLMGVGQFASPPQKTRDYETGYLAGIIRGDGLIGAYYYDRPRRRHGNIYQFRLALTDLEALLRAEGYLLNVRIPTHRHLISKATSAYRAMHSIRTSSRRLVEEINQIVLWPPRLSEDWCKGYLAGIFDAEGSHGQVIRIANTDLAILAYACRALDLLGFDHVVERRPPSSVKPMSYLRLRGGLPARLRFLHTVDPAISRKRDIQGVALKTQARLRVVRIEPLPGERTLVDITTGTGDFIANGVVSHNCYARRTHWFLDQDGIRDWNKKIYVKVDAPAVLRRELAHPSWQREEVHIGTATDPYQPAEGTYRLTRQILEALRDFRTPPTIVTRSSMIVRDRDILRQLAEGPGVMVCFSIATMDAALAREIEPDVPPPLRRLEAMRTLREAGISAGVFLAPVLPGITDHPDQLLAVVQAAKDHGASSLWTNALNLGDVTRQAFFEYLEHRRPELVPQYNKLYRGKYAPSEYRRQLQEVVAALKARVEFRTSSEPRRPDPRPSRPPSQQLPLL